MGEVEVFFRLENILGRDECFPTQITVKYMLHTIRQIWEVLEEPQRAQFRASCFGHFSQLDAHWLENLQKKLGFTGQYVHYVLMKRARTSKKQEMWFNFDGKPARFSILEFAQTTGLVCHQLSTSVQVEAR